MSEPNHESPSGSWRPKAAVRFTLSVSVYVALPLIAAWRIDWTRGWLYVAVMLFTVATNIAIIRRTNPSIIKARSEMHKGTKPFDKAIMALYIPAVTAILIVGGLDAGRFGWSSLPADLLYAGLALHFLGDALIVWVMSVNPFAEPTVRIQTDRGHTVISTGPYRFVRHPMYVGAILMFASWPLILGSAWAFLPMLAAALVIVARTAFEDRTLRAELPGYEEYSRRTRYRLIPRIW